MIRIELDKAASAGLQKMLQNAPGAVKDAIKIGLFRAGHEMRTKAIELSPFKSGNLRRSITVQAGDVEAKVSAGGSVAGTGTNVEYARIHDQGGTIPARIIRPKNGRFLVFMAGGKKVFTRVVRQKSRYQKPYKGRGYMTPAFNEMKSGRAKIIMSEELKNVLQ